MNLIPRWLTFTIITLLALLIIVVGTNQVLLAVSKISPTSSANAHTITVTAEGKVSASPDTAEVDASIVSNGSTAQAVQSAMDKNAAELLTYLEKSGVSKNDISTSEYNLNPQYNYNSSNGNQITGYSASETLSAKIRDLTKVSEILGGITQNGANQIQSIEYTIDNPDALQEQAREQALTNAASQAQNLANAAHVKLGKLVTFSEEDSSTTPPIFPEAMAVGANAGAAMAPSASVPSGTQDITEDVSVTYALR